jgi:hypothetical protein
LVRIIFGCCVLAFAGLVNVVLLYLPLAALHWLAGAVGGRLRRLNLVPLGGKPVWEAASAIIAGFVMARVQVWLWALESGLSPARWTMAIASVCIGAPVYFFIVTAQSRGPTADWARREWFEVLTLVLAYFSAMYFAYSTCLGYRALFWFETELWRAV